MWLRCETIFTSVFRVSNLPRKYQLEQSIVTLKQGSMDLSAYYTKKKTFWEQLSNTKITTARRCNCDHVKELLEEAETSIIQFLMGLNDNFANIRGQILSMKPRPSLTEIYNMLDQDESQRVVGLPQKLSANPVAFQVQDSIGLWRFSQDKVYVLLETSTYRGQMLQETWLSSRNVQRDEAKCSCFNEPCSHTFWDHK